jgi:hypothetical protein
MIKLIIEIHAIKQALMLHMHAIDGPKAQFEGTTSEGQFDSASRTGGISGVELYELNRRCQVGDNV